jgi:nucleoside-diphosphate-sugar epimerase
MSVDLLILGAGFTGRLVARAFAARGARVVVTTRHAAGFHEPGVIVHELAFPEHDTLDRLSDLLRPGTLVLHSLPLLRSEAGLWDPTPHLLPALHGLAQRVVYLSTTGVYGKQHRVDEHTPTAATTPRETLRLAAEIAVASGPWSSMILRPAAIYGPGRGLHQSMREGRFQLAGDGANYISRIHVDDLAAHAEAALLSSASGAWPVADEEPCPSIEIARFCSDLLHLPMPGFVPRSALTETRRSDRRVDGSAVRRLLGIALKYPSYRVGIPACVAAEGR